MFGVHLHCIGICSDEYNICIFPIFEVLTNTTNEEEGWIYGWATTLSSISDLLCTLSFVFRLWQNEDFQESSSRMVMTSWKSVSWRQMIWFVCHLSYISVMRSQLSQSSDMEDYLWAVIRHSQSDPFKDLSLLMESSQGPCFWECSKSVSGLYQRHKGIVYS